MTQPNGPGFPPNDTPPRSLLARLFKVEPGETEPLLLACGYFFCLLGAYYLIRPLRDAMGAESGLDSIKWLYACTMTAILVASLSFSAITTRFTRSRFIPIAYRFFIATFLGFYFADMALPDIEIALGRAFFVWVSVFNLFVVSVFWSFMADLFTNAQGRRLFGVIAVGGTLGQIFGAGAVSALTTRFDPAVLLIAGAILLEAACWCVWRLNVLARRAGTARREPDPPVGGRAWDGLRDIGRSAYLKGIALFMLLYTVTSTYLYLTKLRVGLDLADDRSELVSYFATLDFRTGVLTGLAQIFLTSRLIGRFGVGVTLGILPVVTFLGFAMLAVASWWPAVISAASVVAVFEPLRRSVNFAFARPAREVLYTVVDRDAKYKAKNFIDTFVYRAGDQVAAWTFFGAVAMAVASTVLAVGWLVLALSLGRRQRAMAGDPLH